MTASTAPRIRVLLADDNLIARLGVATLIRTVPDFELVGEAPDGAAALALYRELRPDVVVADLKMPGLDGIGLTEALAAAEPPGRVMVLTQYEGDESIYRALKAGALGYVTKESDGEALLDGIRTVAAGRRYVPPSIAARLADRLAGPALSLRELQVLEHVFRGESNREIAAALHVSERTVGVFVSSILAKLGARSRTEAVAVALARGILVPTR
jgi:two-component system NarL family response regulator